MFCKRLLYGFTVPLFGTLTLVPPGSASPSPHAPQNATAEAGMVASAHRLASEVGARLLRKGGGAVDAAIATALALNVVEPNASGIGGGGFMLVRMADGETELIDFREKAPAVATPQLFYKEGQLQKQWAVRGGRSVAVPGALAGFHLALERYGKRPWSEVFQGAIGLARDGFPVSENQAAFTASEFEALSAYPATAAVYLHESKPLEAGQKVCNPDLAKTFERIAKEGPDVFYRGQIAEAIVRAVTADGGVLTLEDLATYTPTVRKPVQGTYRGHEILSSPPPSSGGTHLLQILAIMENFDVQAMGHNSADTIHTLAEAMKGAFADREAHMADPDFTEVPVAEIIDKDYNKVVASRIQPDRAASTVRPGSFAASPDSPNTTHLCVVDAWGNVVSMTLTINHWFGSAITVPGYGFLLNDEMDDFSFAEGSVNAVEGGKRPLSSMSPTIVLKDNRPVMAVGTPGGIRIITANTQVIMNVIDFGMTMDEAIEAPRFHSFSSGGKASALYLEARIPKAVRQTLEKRGHQIEVKDAYDNYFGGAQGIQISPDGLLIGGADSRRDGACVGY